MSSHKLIEQEKKIKELVATKTKRNANNVRVKAIFETVSTSSEMSINDKIEDLFR